jgi:anti-sigma factor RsiW
MAKIIRLHGDPHKLTQTLLPWYANGSLDPDETTEVEAHLVECADCRADLRLEQALYVGIANPPTDMEAGWSKLRQRVQCRAQPARRRPSRFSRGLPIGWVVTAQAASLAAIVGLAWIAMAQPKPTAATYRALGAAPLAARGNLIVVFKPTTSEQELRAALVDEGARIVDGPTASDADVLRVVPAKRGAALARLRIDSHVLLAEPIDADGRP